MKVEEINESQVEITGDIEQNKVSIDTDNIQFLMQLLTTNLYSNVIGSLLREYVSNSVDSHKEANTDDPILISLLKDADDKLTCEIQDFGTGISEERFKEVFLKIGGSTKKDSNDYIGFMGIGHFSGLAYSNTIYFTSIFDGKKFKYILYKDGSELHVDLLFSVETEEKNGLTVTIPINNLKDYVIFTEEIDTQLLYFTNIFIIDEIGNGGRYNNLDFAECFNKLKIKKYKHFCINTIHQTKYPKLLLGNVSYPLNISYFEDVSLIIGLNIHIPFEIGELSFTPNREEIQYNDRTKEKIQEKINLVNKELEVIIESNKIVDHTNMQEYYQNICRETKIDLGLGCDLYVAASKIEHRLDGVKYNENLFRTLYPTLTQYYTYGKEIWRDRIYKKSKFQINNKKVIICNYSSFTPIEKTWFRKTYEDCILLDKKITYKKFYGLPPNISLHSARLKGEVNKTVDRSKEYYKIVRDHWLRFNQKVVTKNDVPQEYIKEEKAKALINRVTSTSTMNWSEEINLFKARAAYKGTGVAYDSTRCLIKNLHDTKVNKKLTVYTEKGVDTEKYYFGFCKFVNFVQIAPSKIKLLESIPNFITLNDFMNIKNKILRRVATAHYIRKTYPHLGKLASYRYNTFLDFINPELKEIVDIVHKYDSKHMDYNMSESILDACLETCEKHGYMDFEMLSLLERYDGKPKRIVENSKVLLLFESYDRYSNTKIQKESWNMALDYIKARKLFPVSIDAVKKLKEETIYNVKKRRK